MNRLKIFRTALLFIIALFYTGCVEYHNQPQHKSETENLVLDLSGRWKFSLGDDNKWKDEKFDDSKWEKINVPSSWENQGFHGYDGYAWYRTSFKLNSTMNNKDIYLVLGYVDDVDQTFINGKLIGVSGGFPENYRTAYNAFRKYYIPREYLNNDGVNVIAVRIFDDELDGGIMSGKIGLYTYKGGLEPDLNLSGLWEFSMFDDSLFLKIKDTNGSSSLGCSRLSRL